MTDISATRERDTRDGYLVATVRTHTIGDQSPYFSATAELWQSRGWYRNGQDGRMHACGCLHDDIVAAFPNLAPIVALHLSDAFTGEPMYALANGYYHYAQGNLDAACRTLRVDSIPDGLDADAFTAFVDEQRGRWQDEADAGRALIESLTTDGKAQA